MLLKKINLISTVLLIASNLNAQQLNSGVSTTENLNSVTFNINQDSSPTEQAKLLMKMIYDTQINKSTEAFKLECKYKTEAEYQEYKNTINDKDLLMSDDELRKKIDEDFSQAQINFKFEISPKFNQESLDRCFINNQESNAIQFYTGSGYSDLNLSLRTNNLKKIKGYRLLIKILNSALDKIADYQGYVKRGISVSKGLLDDLLVNTLVSHPYYTSTSTGSGFGGNVRYVIYSNKCKNISMISVFKSEREVLCKPGTQFIIRYRDIDKTNNILKLLLEEVSQTFDIDDLIDKLEKKESSTVNNILITK